MASAWPKDGCQICAWGPVPFSSVATAGEGMRLPAGISEYRGLSARSSTMRFCADWHLVLRIGNVSAKIDPTMRTPGGGSMTIVGLGKAKVSMDARSPELLKSIADHEVGAHGAAVGDRKAGLPIGTNPEAAYRAGLQAGVSSPQVEMLRRALERHDARRSSRHENVSALEADRERLVGQLGYSQALARYLQHPGEVLARLEEITQHMRRNGRDPFTMPMSQIDVYDLSKIGPRRQRLGF